MPSLSEIKLLAAEVEDGQTIRHICPNCGGGGSRERTLTLTRDGDSVVYNCFRANCDLRAGCIGRRPNVVYTTLSEVQPRKKKFTKFEGVLEPLPDVWITYLEQRIGWTTDAHFEMGRPMYAPEDHRVAYPIFGPMGVRRGWVLRSYTFGVEPKSLTRRDTEEEPCTSYYVSPTPVRSADGIRPLCIVEDIPSAVRAALYCSSLAMNGSGMGRDAVAELAAHHKNVVWAFDQDATLQALKHHRKYGIYFESSRVLPLEKDLKDMREDDLCAIMNTLKT